MITKISTEFKTIKGFQLKWKKIFIDASHPNETRIVLKSEIFY